MIQSFKRTWYAIISNPLQVTMLIGFIIGMILYASTEDLCWLFFLLLYLIPFAILERTLPKGFPKPIAVPLTAIFYGIRTPSGRVTIVQKRLRQEYSCRDLIRLITAQQSILPAALVTKPGEYRAITHETVVCRIQKMPEAHIESIKPIYLADLSANLKYMTKGKCKHCKQPCPVAIGRKTKRQFYDVKFRIEVTNH